MDITKGTTDFTSPFQEMNVFFRSHAAENTIKTDAATCVRTHTTATVSLHVGLLDGDVQSVAIRLRPRSAPEKPTTTKNASYDETCMGAT